MPLQDADINLLERFLNYFSGMFWIFVLLELPIVAELEFLCRFLQVSISDLDVILLSHEQSVTTFGQILAMRTQ